MTIQRQNIEGHNTQQVTRLCKYDLVRLCIACAKNNNFKGRVKQKTNDRYIESKSIEH